MTPAPSDNARLARQCREALGSLHCELTPREKKVIHAIIVYSLDLELDWAFFGSSDQLALEARIDKSDASNALSSLKRTRLVEGKRANALHPFRRPMLYRVDPDALRRVAAAPGGTSTGAIDKARAANARWLVHANRLYPLQPELLPPDPNEFAEALAEISRASVLAADSPQNGEPKPGHVAREAYPPEQGTPPGRASTSEEPSSRHLTPPPGGWMDPVDVSRLMAESFATAGHPHPALAGEAPAPVGESPTRTGQEGPLVGEFPTTHARASDIRMSDGEKNLSIRNLEGDARGPVGEFPTEIVPPLAIEAGMLLARHGVEWTPPTAAQQVFDELLRCMGGAMANYSHWWWPKCRDPRTRRDVLEAIATWRLASIHPNHKPWRGGAWKNEFHRRQRARLEAERSVTG